jgi:hypothetical protein
VLQPVVGIELRSGQPVGIAGQGIDGGESVQGPGQPARPRGVTAPTLLGGLTQKLSGIKIKDPFVAG